MALVLCPGCGFVKVAGKLCACCAEDAVNHLTQFNPYWAAALGLAKAPPEKQNHAVRVETHLTEKPSRGYVHIAKATCIRCGESYWNIIHAREALAPQMRQRAEYVAATGFSDMIAAQPCRGS